MSAKFKIVCDGRHTVLELDGKTMAKGVKAVRFSHVGGDNATCSIDIDIGSFSFMPDGAYEDACQKLNTVKPPEDQLVGRAE